MPDSGSFHTPSAVANRAFTAIIAVLLVTSLMAPIMVGPAVADDGRTYSLYCEPFEVGVTEPMCDTSVSDVTADETIMHSMAVSEAESADSHNVGMDNHLQDTNTIASIEARHAIATAWEDGESESDAYQAALEAIRDYYATHQKNHLEHKSKTTIQLSNVAHTAKEDDDMHDRWVSSSVTDGASGTNRAHLTDNQTTTTAELVNGETYEFDTAHMRIYMETNLDDDAEYLLPHNLAHPQYDYNDRTRVEVEQTDGGTVADDSYTVNQDWYGDPDWNGRLTIPNVGDIEDGGLASETVFDGWEWRDRWLEIEQQSDQAVANYDVEFVEALYAELDAGNIDPEDVRGAEGMARHLSGDSEVTDQRFRLALMQLNGMTNPDLAGASSMTVEYEGYTDITFNGSTDERVPELSGYTDGTYEGLLFASEVPESGFEVGQEYAIGDVNTTGTDLEPVNGSAQIFDVTDGETTHFHEGEFTVTEMYDADGNEVDQIEWDQPEYDTYNASEFAAYLEEVKDLREAITQDEAHGGGGGGDGGTETNTLLIAGVLLVLVAMGMAAVAGDS